MSSHPLLLICSRSSTAQPDVSLTIASQEVGCSTDSLSSLRAQLSNIQDSVLKTHDAVILQTTAVNSVLQSISVPAQRHVRAINESPLNQEALSLENRYKDDANDETRRGYQTNCGYTFSSRSLSPTPMTSLEASRQFFPESYTVDAQIPLSCLVVVEHFEQSTLVDSKTNVYRLIYLNSFRRWQWLTIYMQIPRSSRYWTATKVTQQDKGRKWQTSFISSSAGLPYSLVRKIQGFLRQEVKVNDNAKVHLSLCDRDDIKLQTQVSNIDILSTPSLPLPVPSYTLAYLHDLGCQQYNESEVIQITMVNPPDCFCSTINGILVYEIKSKDSTPSVGMLYNIRVLHCMKGSSGFANLVGIVTDNSRKHLKSYLIEVSKVYCNILQMAEKPFVSWERRENVAVQLVRGIERIHTHGFVVGGLHLWTIPFIDETDSVQFWSFKERFTTGRVVGAYYPPEFLHVRDMPANIDEADSPYVTSKTDIFHLGLMLWLLAENKPETHASPVCRRRGCNGRQDESNDDTNFCDISHAEPIALPLLPDTIPVYYRDIVDACRREDPCARPAAREILDIFSSYERKGPDQQRGRGQPGLLQQQNHRPDIETVADSISIYRTSCSICKRRPIFLPYYHCNSCRMGDFDLCQSCYDRGIHCHDDEHLLVELGKIGSWVVPRRYHSSIKGPNRRREVYDL